MPDYKAKVHRIRFLLALRPRPCWESLHRSLDALAVFKGPNSNGKEGIERGGRERGEEESREGSSCL